MKCLWYVFSVVRIDYYNFKSLPLAQLKNLDMSLLARRLQLHNATNLNKCNLIVYI
jgi:hypothetical protein